jgi:hypothetical protein
MLLRNHNFKQDRLVFLLCNQNAIMTSLVDSEKIIIASNWHREVPEIEQEDYQFSACSKTL